MKGTRSLVLGCHRVIANGPLKPGLDVSPGWLREVVKLPYRFLTVAESLRHPDIDVLALSFDDGDPSIGSNALPALAQLGIKATAFVIVHPEEAAPPFWRDLLAAGWEIGSHSLTHPGLDFLDAARARAEICESKLRLEDVLQTPVRGFAFPYGRFGRREIDLACEAGYEYAVTTVPWLPRAWRSDGITMVPRKMCEESTPMWKIRALADSWALRFAAWLHDEAVYRFHAARNLGASPLRVLPHEYRPNS
jgi:peptidoglycan/xylan/chitin deacetylase (PgdA/CDA1 family)